MSARSTGAAPRQRGKERRVDVEPEPLGEHSSGTIRPYATATTVGAPTSRPGCERVRLQYRDPEPQSRVLGRRACELASPARWSVRTREQRADLVSLGKAFQDVGAERRGRGDRDRSGQRAPRTGCGLSVASAARRDSSSVRSMISTPSRWSSSCWTTRDDGGSSSSFTGSPFASTPSIVTFVGRSTGTSTSRSERHPSSSISISPRALRDHRVHDARDPHPRPRRRTAAGGRRPAWRRARRRSPRASARSCARRGARGRRRRSRPPAPSCGAPSPRTGGSARARAGDVPRARAPVPRRRCRGCVVVVVVVLVVVVVVGHRAASLPPRDGRIPQPPMPVACRSISASVGVDRDRPRSDRSPSGDRDFLKR